MAIKEKLVGKKFNRWTVIKKISREKCICKCECGNVKEVWVQFLINGRSKSCGCLRRELTSQRMSSNLSYLVNTKFYFMYRNIIGRCYYKSTDSYIIYGGRGIRVCDEWRTFRGFFNDMYEDYKKHVKKYGEKNTSIDRIDVNGNYCKENCRWATLKEQSRNTRISRILTYKGVTKPLYDWADDLGMKYATIANRWHMGWDHNKIIEEPLNN